MDVRSDEVNKAAKIFGLQIVGDIDGHRQCKSLIKELEEDLKQHLDLYAIAVRVVVQHPQAKRLGVATRPMRERE